MVQAELITSWSDWHRFKYMRLWRKSVNEQFEGNKDDNCGHNLMNHPQSVRPPP
jgi:hypothetical protein